MKKITQMKSTSIPMFVASALPESLALGLSAQAKLWPSLGDIQNRVIRLFGDVVPCPEQPSESLLMVTLVEMNETWLELHQEDELMAFRHVCINILKRSRDLLSYKVMAIHQSNNVNMLLWDPIERDFTDFISYSKTRHLYLDQIEQSASSDAFRQQASLLFINKIFGRADLKRLGVMPYNSESSTDIYLIDLLMNPEKLLIKRDNDRQEVTYGS